ncbi:MAG TPA: UpxY family transcription antiterminator [Ferruginibacter sp.]|nr:UpxY family transcription antiterminator [Ferruginibacter sp.]HMP20258.1 UpxY family transcription antiterminator [Ferruginibacter sp.]
MERKWHVICTTPGQERKVAAQLTKRGIENYCPFNRTVIKNGTRETSEVAPLFKGFVFVQISNAQIAYVRRLPYVINMVYWRSKPVVVSAEEIDGIKLMIESYTDIQLHQVQVNTDKKMFVEKETETDYGGTMLSLKHKGLSITLPSLGFKMSARVERKGDLLPEERNAAGSLIPRILNPLYLFGF